MSTEPIATYPVGTKIKDVRHFDRSTKVVFSCPDHLENKWASKDPNCSSWFPATREMSLGGDCSCKVEVGDMVVTETYQPTRNG